MKYVVVLKIAMDINGQQRAAGEVVIVDDSFDFTKARRIVRVIHEESDDTGTNSP